MRPPCNARQAPSTSPRPSFRNLGPPTTIVSRPPFRRWGPRCASVLVCPSSRGWVPRLSLSSPFLPQFHPPPQHRSLPQQHFRPLVASLGRRRSLVLPLDRIFVPLIPRRPPSSSLFSYSRTSPSNLTQLHPPSSPVAMAGGAAVSGVKAVGTITKRQEYFAFGTLQLLVVACLHLHCTRNVWAVSARQLAGRCPLLGLPCAA